MWPLRIYLRLSPLRRGKARILKTLIIPTLPPLPASFVAQVPGGGLIRLHHRESLGISVLGFGGFEKTEIRTLSRYARPGSTAVDVGANVGIVTVPLAFAVGPFGRVLAFEPNAGNVDRLRENLLLNHLSQVSVHALALGATPGDIVLNLGSDPAFHSSVEVMTPWRTNNAVTVPCSTLDVMWEEAESPDVSVVKIDVEGGELAVLKGARTMLDRDHPALLVEAHDNNYDQVAAWLGELGYESSRPRGFNTWNYLFLPARCSRSIN